MIALLGKATFVLLLALLVTRVTRRARASMRHAILLAALAMLAAMPIAAALMPPVALPILPSPAPSLAPHEAAPAPAGDLPSSSDPKKNLAPSSPHVFDRARELDGMTLLTLIWATGAVVVFVPVTVGILRTRRLRRSALPCRAAQRLAELLGETDGARHNADVVVHEAISSPMTAGIWRPAIVLPADAGEWDTASLSRALRHELEHVGRLDWATQVFARIVCALYWFHPLVWMVNRQLCLEAEHACDDAVVAREEHTMYAEQLVALARRMTARPAAAVLGMAERSDLAARVAAVLDLNRARGRTGPLAAGLIAASAIASVLAVAPLRLVAAPPDSPTTGSMLRAQSPVADAGSPREDARTPAVDARSPVEDADSPRESFVTARERAAGGQRSTRASRLDRMLVEAADEGDLDDVRELLDRGVNVNAAVDGDGTPLIAAARGGHVDIVRLLLDRGADVNLPVPGDGAPLLMAAREGHVEIVRLLLDRGADIELMVKDDENALIQASAEGQLAVVELLIGRGADVNARAWAEPAYERPSGEWRTPLSVATREGHRAVVTLLRAHGAR
jgi:beta-lactamase regulating signal transducer with metallopeptidase domain